MVYFTDLFGLPYTQESDGGGNGGGRAQRLCGARDHFPRAQGDGQTGEHEAGGERGGAAVVGDAGFAGHAQSHVDRERPGALLRDPVSGARERGQRARSARSTIPTSRR